MKLLCWLLVCSNDKIKAAQRIASSSSTAPLLNEADDEEYIDVVPPNAAEANHRGGVIETKFVNSQKLSGSGRSSRTQRSPKPPRHLILPQVLTRDNLVAHDAAGLSDPDALELGRYTDGTDDEHGIIPFRRLRHRTTSGGDASVEENDNGARPVLSSRRRRSLSGGEASVEDGDNSSSPVRRHRIRTTSGGAASVESVRWGCRDRTVHRGSIYPPSSVDSVLAPLCVLVVCICAQEHSVSRLEVEFEISKPLWQQTICSSLDRTFVRRTD